MAAASKPSRVTAIRVHFAPSARTTWHTQPYGQTIYVTDGMGRCQRRGVTEFTEDNESGSL
jgi:quercetin dioxygenase-like cupin family protein